MHSSIRAQPRHRSPWQRNDVPKPQAVEKEEEEEEEEEEEGGGEEGECTLGAAPV